MPRHPWGVHGDVTSSCIICDRFICHHSICRLLHLSLGGGHGRLLRIGCKLRWILLRGIIQLVDCASCIRRRRQLLGDNDLLLMVINHFSRQLSICKSRYRRKWSWSVCIRDRVLKRDGLHLVPGLVVVPSSLQACRRIRLLVPVLRIGCKLRWILLRGIIQLVDCASCIRRRRQLLGDNDLLLMVINHFSRQLSICKSRYRRKWSWSVCIRDRVLKRDGLHLVPGLVVVPSSLQACRRIRLLVRLSGILSECAASSTLVRDRALKDGLAFSQLRLIRRLAHGWHLSRDHLVNAGQDVIAAFLRRLCSVHWHSRVCISPAERII